MNRDGNVDLLDVAPLVDVLDSGDFQDEPYMNQDSPVELLDVAPFGCSRRVAWWLLPAARVAEVIFQLSRRTRYRLWNVECL